MKSRVMVLRAFKEPLTEEVFEIPVLEEGQVLVKLDAAGVCGSDVHMSRGEDPRIPLPIILGHEGVGTVVDTKGPRRAITGEALKNGDRIIWNRGVSCGKCYYCAVLKEPALCPNRRANGIDVGCAQAPYLNGCYAEYTILPAGTDIFTVDKSLDPALLVTASCSGATACHGFDMERPRVGDTVVVQGSGPIGLYSVALAKAAGAAEIIVTGDPENRLKLCGEFGATTLLDRTKTTVEERRAIVMEKTGGRGADFVVEGVGYPDALAEGLELPRRGGTYLSIGFGQPMGTIPFDGFSHLVHRNLRIQGTWVSDSSHTLQALRLVQANPALFQKLVTHRFALEQANEAIGVMYRKEALKAVLLPGMEEEKHA